MMKNEKRVSLHSRILWKGFKAISRFSHRCRTFTFNKLTEELRPHIELERRERKLERIRTVRQNLCDIYREATVYCYVNGQIVDEIQASLRSINKLNNSDRILLLQETKNMRPHCPNLHLTGAFDYPALRARPEPYEGRTRSLQQVYV